MSINFYLICILFTSCVFSNPIDYMYYQGKWETKMLSIFKIEKNNGFLELKITNTTFHKGDYTLISGQIGIRFGYFIEDDYLLLNLVGVFDSNKNKIYMYIYDSVISTDFTTLGNPFTYSLLHSNKHTSPLFTDYEAHLQFQTLFEQNRKEKGDSVSYDPSLITKDVYIYVGELNVVFNRGVTDEEWENYDFIENKVRGIYNLETSSPFDCTTTVCKEKSSFYFNATTYLPQKFFDELLYYTYGIGILQFISLTIITLQMSRNSHSASLTAKVSVGSISMFILYDSYGCLFHLVLSLHLGGSFYLFAVLALFYFASFSGFLMKWLIEIMKSRGSWRQNRRNLSVLYARFYITLFVGLFIIFKFPILKKVVIYFLFSFWVPQIFRNVTENIKIIPFSYMYIILSSLSKLGIIIYFFAIPNNFLKVKNDYIFCLIIILHVIIQMSVLILQKSFGGRFFVPKFLLPKRYNYEREIPTEVLEQGGAHCVVCMDDIDQTIKEGNKRPLVTPCNHVFHKDCLIRWMEEKLVCPICRKELPFTD